jgi:hypothetical protein
MDVPLPSCSVNLIFEYFENKFQNWLLDEGFFQHSVDALLNPKVLIDRPVSLRSTSFELQAREGLYEDKKNDCQLDGRRRHKVGPNLKIPPSIRLKKFVKLNRTVFPLISIHPWIISHFFLQTQYIKRGNYSSFWIV